MPESAGGKEAAAPRFRGGGELWSRGGGGPWFGGGCGPWLPRGWPPDSGDENLAERAWARRASRRPVAALNLASTFHRRLSRPAINDRNSTAPSQSPLASAAAARCCQVSSSSCARAPASRSAVSRKFATWVRTSSKAPTA